MVRRRTPADDRLTSEALLREGGWSSGEIEPRHTAGGYLRFSRALQRTDLLYEDWATRGARVVTKSRLEGCPAGEMGGPAVMRRGRRPNRANDGRLGATSSDVECVLTRTVVEDEVGLHDPPARIARRRRQRREREAVPVQ